MFEGGVESSGNGAKKKFGKLVKSADRMQRGLEAGTYPEHLRESIQALIDNRRQMAQKMASPSRSQRNAA